MKKDIIIFGTGHYGKNTYWKLKSKYHIVAFADNDSRRQGTYYEDVPVMAGEDLKTFNMENTDIVVASRAYYEIGAQLFAMQIDSYYVMIEGFLYHTDLTETMMPTELCETPYHRKESGEKNILFVQNAACVRTHKIAKIMKEEGYKVYLLYTVAPPYGAYEQYTEIYEQIWGFSSANGILDFINHSEFDIVHCANEPDILVNIARKSNKPVIADTHDMQSIRSNVGIETLVLEFLANKNSDGVMYTSAYGAEVAKEKYQLNSQKVFVLNNLVMDVYPKLHRLSKLSASDYEIHCVYEGGVVGDDRNSHRFFDDMWRQITEAGVHIHFYSPSDIVFCKRLESISPLIHYEGSLSGEKLISEMTRYDCGLALFHSVDSNRVHLETASPNKVYEYASAGLPVITKGIHSMKEFVERYYLGIELDFSRDIRKQLEKACKIPIDHDFLNRNRMTMKAYGGELAAFYEQVKQSK